MCLPKEHKDDKSGRDPGNSNVNDASPPACAIDPACFIEFTVNSAYSRQIYDRAPAKSLPQAKAGLQEPCDVTVPDGVKRSGNQVRVHEKLIDHTLQGKE